MIGAGGHAKVIFDITKIMGMEVSYVVDTKREIDKEFSLLKHIKSDYNIIKNLLPNETWLINALGIIPGKEKNLRERIYNFYKKRKYAFITIIHPQTIISKNVQIGEGVNIMAGAVIQTGTVIHENTIINTGAIIDHECVIQKNVHVAPGVVICGNVQIGKNTFIGAGANILPNTIIPENSLIGAGKIFK